MDFPEAGIRDALVVAIKEEKEVGYLSLIIVQWCSQDSMYGRAHIGGLYEVEVAPGKDVPPPAQRGGMGEHCKLPIGVWGGAQGANAFLIHKITKTALYIIYALEFTPT